MPPSTLFRKSAGNLSGPTLTVDFIDVGQGNCVLVSYPNGEFMLADCGSQTTSRKSRPYLHAASYITSVTQGAKISCVVLSHGDDDHTAFVPYIDEASSPTYLHFGGSIGDYSVAVQTYIHAQENTKGKFVFRYPEDYSVPEADADFASETTSGEAHVMVLSANYGFTPNTRSIVLMIRFGRSVVVLPGDAESTTETFILSKVPSKVLKNVTVLMPGHHGAYESTSRAWADQLQPDIDAISASGTNMSYAHPACATNELLLESAVPGTLDHDITCSEGRGQAYESSSTEDALLTTATNGDIRFVTDGTNWRLLASSAKALLALPPAPHPVLDQMVANAPWRRHIVVPHADPPGRARVTGVM